MEQKIRNSFLIKLGSRKLEKQEKFSKWLDAQSNAQNSILSLVEHAIDRFGYDDIMDHEIAQKMHTEIIYFSNPEDPRIDMLQHQGQISIHNESSAQKEMSATHESTMAAEATEVPVTAPTDPDNDKVQDKPKNAPVAFQADAY